MFGLHILSTEFHGNTASDNRPDSPTGNDSVTLKEMTNERLDQLKCNLLNQLNSNDDEMGIDCKQQYV